MKKIFFVTGIFLFSTIVRAGDDGKADFSVGADLVSSYVWRGMYLSGTSLQPAMDFSIGNFSIGACGSVDIAGLKYKEVDLTASYSFGNFTAGFFNYWVSEENAYNYFDYSENTVHQLEANLLYSFDPFPLTLGWNTIIAGVDTLETKDKRAFSTYLEATYTFSVKEVNIQAALGVSPWKSNALYTKEYFFHTGKTIDGPAVVNISLTASKDIKINDKYSLGVFGQLAYNPACNDAFFVFGIKF